MLYVLEYEICAFIFLIVVAAHYFSKRRFPNNQNELFSFILILAFFDLLLDIGGSITISYAKRLPEWVNMLINMTFYAIQIVLPATMVLYTLALAGKYRKRNLKQIFFILLPAAGFIAILLTNPFTHIYFYVDMQRGYVHGPWFASLYVGSIYYMALTVIVVLRNRDRIPRTQTVTILAFVLACVAGVIIQYFFPRVLLTGMVIALSITMMYLTMQNPEDMLDPLTGVFNRTAMMRLLSDNIEDKRAFSVIGVEINEMHRINTLFSEKAGNELLSGIGAFLSEIVGNSWIFRMMGNRFVMVTESGESFEHILTRIRGRFSGSFSVNGVNLPISHTRVTIPEASFVHSAEEVAHLLELGFPIAQKLGDGGEARIDEGMIGRIERARLVEDAVRRAIDHDSFELYLQPIYSIRDDTFPMAEALVRLTDPALGRISPTEFIPIAEQNGLITKIDECMLRRTSRFIMRVHPRYHYGVTNIEVNLSAINLMQTDVAERVFSILRAEGVEPAYVNIEVTESAATSSEEQMQHCIQKLRERGMRIMLDDFGTGYANMARIANLPLYGVKLDKSMLDAYDENQKSAIIFENTIALCKKLGLLTLVEGVETAEQAALVKGMGADFIQGFYYATPFSEDAYVAFLERRNQRGPAARAVNI